MQLRKLKLNSVCSTCSFERKMLKLEDVEDVLKFMSIRNFSFCLIFLLVLLPSPSYMSYRQCKFKSKSKLKKHHSTTHQNKQFLTNFVNFQTSLTNYDRQLSFKQLRTYIFELCIFPYSRQCRCINVNLINYFIAYTKIISNISISGLVLQC